MPKNRKRQLLGLMTLISVLMVLLAISLPELQMQPGDVFSLRSSGQQAGYSSSQEIDDAPWFQVLVQAMGITLMLLLPIYLVISLLSEEGRTKMLVDSILIAFAMLLVLWLKNKGLSLTISGGPLEVVPVTDGSLDLGFDTGTPPTFEANPEPWMLPIIMFVAAVLFAGIAFVTIKYIANLRSKIRSPYLDIAENARTAMKEIEGSTSDFDDVIIRCYAEMSLTLLAESNIQRSQSMTTYEFEQELLARGFPDQPVQRLTKLFEQVRYGHQQPMEHEKQVAAKCLGEIIDYCKGQI